MLTKLSERSVFDGCMVANLGGLLLVQRTLFEPELSGLDSILTDEHFSLVAHNGQHAVAYLSLDAPDRVLSDRTRVAALFEGHTRLRIWDVDHREGGATLELGEMQTVTDKKFDHPVTRLALCANSFTVVTNGRLYVHQLSPDAPCIASDDFAAATTELYYFDSNTLVVGNGSQTKLLSILK